MNAVYQNNKRKNYVQKLRTENISRWNNEETSKWNLT